MLPVFNREGEVVGANLRSLSGESPKSKLHAEPNVMAWYNVRRSKDAVLVEDQFSAIRASRYMNAVALLGTHINDERVEAIRNAGFHNVYLALDADAYSKAISYAVKYRGALGVQVVRLHKDIKDMTELEADSLFSTLENFND